MLESEMKDLTGLCVCCHGPADQTTQAVLFPRAWSHATCFNSDPQKAMMMAEAIPCCMSAQILSTFGGMLLQKRLEIPQDQIWIHYDKKLTRYSTKTWERLPDPPRGKASDADPEPLFDLEELKKTEAPPPSKADVKPPGSAPSPPGVAL